MSIRTLLLCDRCGGEEPYSSNRELTFAVVGSRYNVDLCKHCHDMVCDFVKLKPDHPARIARGKPA